jgi:subtilisin family serine protease
VAVQPSRRPTARAAVGAVALLLLTSVLAGTAAAARAPQLREPTTPGEGRADRTAADDGEQVVDAPSAGTPILGRYIVVFRPGTNARAEAERTARANGGQVERVYEHALSGFAGRFSEQGIQGVRRNPNVQLVEQDTVVTVAATQTSPTWGLDRVDERDLPLDAAYVYTTDAAAVHAYVVDTGIRLGHGEFAGRMGAGFDAVTSGGTANDCNGHGTHVAGTVGGTTYGIAKRVTLHPVRVLGCNGSGTNSGVIAGVDWVAGNAIKPAVANMSLGGGASSALDTAVSNAISRGITFAVAAGNDNANACNYSPARVASAVTVGSTTMSDARSSFSNFGTCLDLFAPGSNITSAWHTSDTATNTISGTSMASPHVAGVAALALAANPSATPQQVRDQIVATATTGKVTSAGTGSPNALLYSLLGTAPSPSPSPSPTPGTNVLANPGFESGRTGWTESSSGGYALIGTDRPRTGSYGAWLGGYNGATESITQTVTVPSSGTLTYWWRMETAESGSTVYDRLRVQVLSSSGSVLATLRTWSNASTANTWSQDTLSLSAYAGQSVGLRFLVTTDSSLATSFFLDDTSLS